MSRTKVSLPAARAKEMIAQYLVQMSGGTIANAGDIEVEILDDNHQLQVDIGIVVALTEEFDQVFPLIAPMTHLDRNTSQYSYSFEHTSPNNVTYKCAATLIGGMGPSKAALSTDRLLTFYTPDTVVNIGIAGSMDDGVLLGDVIVADQVDDYISNAKAINRRSKRDFEFDLSGDPYKSTDAIISHVTNLKYAYPKDKIAWTDKCRNDFASVVSIEAVAELQKIAASSGKKLIGNEPQIVVGHIGSGPIVGSSEEFVKWLKTRRDRKYIAIEMEAAGVLIAAWSRPTKTVVIRGVSDFADKRKKVIDSIESGAFRKYAMRNAVNCLWTLMDLGLL